MARAGEARTTPSRDSMQLFIATRREGAWRVAAVMNARRMTLETQAFWDDLESLSPAGRRQVTELVASLARKDR